MLNVDATTFTWPFFPGKKPELKKIKAKNVQTGRRLQLRCRLRSGKPDPTIVWTKDGVPISGKTKGVQIKKRKYVHIKILN